MQNYQFKIVAGVFIILSFVLIIVNFKFCIANAGTLEDIRKKTGWQPPRHSERSSTFIPILTPAELIANLTRYHRDTIRMQALFHSITTRDLNVWIGPKGNRHRWPSTRYISFNIKDPQGRVLSKDINLFISKSNPDVDRLIALSDDTPILIIGMVRNIARGKAWIEVVKIDPVSHR